MEELSVQLSESAPTGTLISQLAEVTARLGDLDPESPDWEAVADCAARIAAALEQRAAALADLQATQRKAISVRRAALRQALDALTSVPNLELYSLGLARLWSEEQVDAPLLETVTAGVHELRGKLEAFTQERARVLGTFATPDELIRLAALVDEVNALRTQMLEWFGAANEPAAPAPQPPLEPAAEEGGLTPPPPTDGLEVLPAGLPDAEEQQTLAVRAKPATPPPPLEPGSDSVALVMEPEPGQPPSPGAQVDLSAGLDKTSVRDDGLAAGVDEHTLERTLYIDLEFDDPPAWAMPGIDVAQVLSALQPLDVAAMPEMALADDEWKSFASQLVVNGDVAAAYWVARSLEEQPKGGVLCLPAPLLAAVQASWWLQTAEGTLASDLMRVIFDYFPGEDAEIRVAAASAGLLPAPVSYTHLDVYKRQVVGHGGRSTATGGGVHAGAPTGGVRSGADCGFSGSRLAHARAGQSPETIAPWL